MFPCVLRFFAFATALTAWRLRRRSFLLLLLRLRPSRLRLGRRTSCRLCDAFSLWLLLSRRTLSLRGGLSFLPTVSRLLHDLPLWRCLPLWCGRPFFLTTVHTRRLLDHLPPWRSLPLWRGLSPFLPAIDFRWTLNRLCRSFHGLRGSTVRLVGISTYAFVSHVELLTLASIRHGLNA